MAYKKVNIGSISSGTLRSEDLIPEFLWELKQQPNLTEEHSRIAKVIEDNMTDENYPDYFESEAAAFNLEALFDALDTYCLPYFYFGSCPGDGADFGYWLSEEFQDEFEGLQVSDLSEVPEGYFGEVLQVSDHGNLALYVRHSNGDDEEIWSIV